MYCHALDNNLERYYIYLKIAFVVLYYKHLGCLFRLRNIDDKHFPCIITF